MNDFIQADLCIIGAGSGGLSIAAGASQLGLSVVLIEKGAMGGDCLNTGCVPSKALLAAAKRAHAHRLDNIAGISADVPLIDFGQVKDHVKGVIKTIEPHDSVERFEGLGVRVIQGVGTFVDRQTVVVNEQRIQAKHFVIATGSRASIPNIPGLDASRVLTHESLFDLVVAPDHLVIIGGGPVGIEMAQAHRRLGVSVTVIERDQILHGHDREHVQPLREVLQSEGVVVHENTHISQVTHHDKGATVYLEQGDAIEASHLLVAAGRIPQTQGLGLEAAGVASTEHGIISDAHLKTTNRRIFAVGDVSGGPLFTHAAGYQAGVVIKQVCFKMRWAKVSYSALPRVTYTDPEMAQVGLTETDAKARFGDRIKVVSWDVADNDRAVAEGFRVGHIKVITDRKGKILGVSLVGPGAGELLAPWTLAMSQGLKISAMAQVVAPYPTLGEISKRAAGSWYSPTLFSAKTKRLVRFLSKLPI
jgi:pyruvate/2-oxoglutarate dehydrogenase complex dihydrolipoamide dehydrogenase (E3) component